MFYHFTNTTFIDVAFQPFMKHKILECHHTIIILTAAAVETVPRTPKTPTNKTRNVAAIANRRAAISCS